jgi:hypothetical protein
MVDGFSEIVNLPTLLVHLPAPFHLHRRLPPLLPQAQKHQKPYAHLQKCPRKHQSILQRVPRPHVLVFALPKGRRLGHRRSANIGVRRQPEEHEKSKRGLRAPVFDRDVFGHGDGGEVGEGQDKEEDRHKGRCRGGRVEGRDMRLCICQPSASVYCSLQKMVPCAWRVPSALLRRAGRRCSAPQASVAT